MPRKNQAAAAKTIAWSEALESWIYSGLLSFWRGALPVDNGVYSLLKQRAQAIDGEVLDWPAAHQHWQQLVSDNRDQSGKAIPLLQLIEDYQLTQAQLYMLVLTGLLETHHLANLAIAELQAPDQAARPCVHLYCALLEHLFPERQYNALDISEQPLLRAGVLALTGDAPLPFQRLSLDARLWSILLGRQIDWPGCQLQPVAAEDEWLLSPSAHADIQGISGLLTRKTFSRNLFNGLVVRGNPNTGRGLFSHALAGALGLKLIATPLSVWQQQPVFALACRYAGWLPVIRPQLNPSDTLRFMPTQTPVVIILGSDGAVEGDMLEVNLQTPQQDERYRLWLKALGSEQQNGKKIAKKNLAVQQQQQVLANHLAASALLSAHSIQLVAGHAQQLAQVQQQTLELPHIAEARRKLGAEKLRLLAQPITREVTAAALVVPALVEQALDALVLRACRREALWEGLGNTLQATPNPGVRALFVGESGTGKTLAASYIATRLGAPLYRVDLSAVMNKYIGESEKNLAQLLDQAAASDVVLLFDEADALFGNRGEGQENGERFANMLTNFLLTRIETHPGIVILTTNSRERIDSAFTRRLDTIVEFPLPGYEERLQLWRSHLGERGPGENVYRHLAGNCDLAGGQLRNVVLTAAVYAEGNAISNANLLEGLRAEYRKQGREMPKKLEALALQ
ncbi:MAG TPA: ATP-binding protein [Cellvibrio sp.]|nr:ATP-binding protein [Cellvibrio sp.]